MNSQLGLSLSVDNLLWKLEACRPGLVSYIILYTRFIKLTKFLGFIPLLRTGSKLSVSQNVEKGKAFFSSKRNFDPLYHSVFLI